MGEATAELDVSTAVFIISAASPGLNETRRVSGWRLARGDSAQHTTKTRSGQYVYADSPDRRARLLTTRT
jgi:hypothetical protein